MSRYSAIKAATNAYIKTNGRQEITGNILNSVMVATIESLGRFFQFVGEAKPDTNPGNIDQNVAYIASTDGEYTHMGGFTLAEGEVSILKFDGEWKKEIILIIPRKVSQLENDLGFITNAVADLVNYYTKSETFTKDEVTAILSNYYDKDDVDTIVGSITGQSFLVSWDGTAEPVVADIPQGVSVTWNGNTYTGTLAPSADTIGNIYLVKGGVGYDEYITTDNNGYGWITIGSTTIDLSGYATLADLALVVADLTALDKKVDENEAEIKQDIYREFVDVDAGKFYGNYEINSSGTMSSNSGCKVYRYPVRQGDVFSVYTKASVSYAAISFSTEASPASVTMVMMNTGDYNYFTYKAPADGYVFILAALNNTIKVLQNTGDTPLETFGVRKFTHGNNVLQPFVGTDVTNDTDIWGDGYLNSSGNVVSTSNYYYTKDYIPVLPGLYLSRFSFSSNARICYYDKDRVLLGSLSSGHSTESRSRTLPNGAAFVRISLNGSNTNTLSMVFQDEGKVVVDVPEINRLDGRISVLESTAIKMIDNNLVNDFEKIRNAGWTIRTERNGAFSPVTENTYGKPDVQYAIPIDPSARVLHIKFKFKFSNGKLEYNGGSLNQPMMIVKSSSSYLAAIRQQASLYNSTSGLMTRRQFFVVQQGSNVNNTTMGDGEKDCLWGEPAYMLWYKGSSYGTAYQYTINTTASGILVKDGDEVLETISVADDELVESVIARINSDSEYLSAKAYEVAGLKYSDTLLISGVPLCLSSGTKLYLFHSLLDTRWHDVEAVIDYEKLKSWTNIDGHTIRRDITDVAGNLLYLGGQVDATIGMSPYLFKDLHIGYGYEDAEVITYPDNVSGTIERLISEDSPYLMVFEGHGIEDKTNTQGTINDMDATTDRLRVVFEYLRSKGFVPVSWREVKDWRLNGAKLPRRCYTLMFDDFRIENYMNNSLREPFVQFGVKPGLAIITGSGGQTRSRDEQVTIDGQTWTLGECFDAIIKGGWYPCSHTKGHNIVNNVAYADLLSTLKDWIYSCDKLGIYDDILVYPQGLASEARRSLFPVSGFALGVGVSVNGYNSRLRTRYKFIRNEIGQRKALADILAQIV